MARKQAGGEDRAPHFGQFEFPSGLGRRAYLRTGVLTAAAAVALTGTVASRSPTVGASSSDDGIEFRGYRFDRIVHAVDDLGLDPTGSEPINEILYRDTGPGDLVLFPDGEYLCTDAGNYEAEGGSIGWVAESAFASGDADYDYAANVTFIADRGTNGYCPDVASGARLDFLFEGIDYDFSMNDEDRSGRCILGIRLHLRGDFDIRNCDTRGRAINYDNPGQEEQMLACSILTPDGRGLIHGCDWREQHDWALYTTLDGSGAGGRMGIWTGEQHVGHIVIDELLISEIGNNAFYMSTTDLEHEGTVVLRNSYVANCGAGGARLPMSRNSRIENTVFEYDASIYTGPDYTDQQANSVANRPVVIETTGQDGYHKDGPFIIRGCHFRIRDTARPAPTIHAYPGGRWVVVEDCTFDLKDYDQAVTSPHSATSACLVQMSEARPHWGGQPKRTDPAPLEMRNCRAVVENVGGAGESLITIADRDGSVIEDCCFEAIGTSHDGVTVESWDRSYGPFQVVIADSRIAVAGRPVVDIGDNDIHVSNIADGGSCSIDPLEDAGPGTYTTDFRNGPGGAGPPGWTLRWHSKADDWTHRPDEGRLEFASDVGERRALSWDVVPHTVRDVEVLSLLQADEIAADHGGNHARIHVRSSGSPGAENGYFFDLRSAGFGLSKYVNGTGELLSESGSPESGTWYWIRLRVHGTDLRLRHWELGEAEPDDWHIEVADRSHRRGWVGLGSWSPETSKWAAFSVGTGGVDAPMVGGDSSDDSVDLGRYTADDDVVDTDGLLEAIGDWRAGELDTGTLERVIESWRERSPID